MSRAKKNTKLVTKKTTTKEAAKAPAKATKPTNKAWPIETVELKATVANPTGGDPIEMTFNRHAITAEGWKALQMAGNHKEQVGFQTKKEAMVVIKARRAKLRGTSTKKAQRAIASIERTRNTVSKLAETFRDNEEVKNALDEAIVALATAYVAVNPTEKKEEKEAA